MQNGVLENHKRLPIKELFIEEEKINHSKECSEPVEIEEKVPNIPAFGEQPLKLTINIPKQPNGMDSTYVVDVFCDKKMSILNNFRKSAEYSTPTMNNFEQSYIKIRVKLPRSKMPYRWRDPPQPIKTCLDTSFIDISPRSPTGFQTANINVLKRALSKHDAVDQDSWLTSSFIDLVFSKFARVYRDVHFMPVEFAAFRLKSSKTQADCLHITDILGNRIDYKNPKSIIFFANIQNMHWNLVRVEHNPFPEVQLFEPLGKPVRRGGGAGVSFRSLPYHIIHWLDTCWPLQPSESWSHHTYSAITKQHQITGFDCGVACLLYAEKCGLGLFKEDIDAFTSQKDITEFRSFLMDLS